MTPSFIGRMAMMLAGVRPSISFASLPTASTRPVLWLTAMIDGSHSTMPLPLAYTSVVAVPRSIARSFENRLSTDLGLQAIVAPTCASFSSVPVKDRGFVQDSARQHLTNGANIRALPAQSQIIDFGPQPLPTQMLTHRSAHSARGAIQRTVRTAAGRGLSTSARATPFLPRPFTRYIA